MASRYHIFDGLTIRNTDVAIFAGQKEVLGAVGLTVKNCRFENVGFGVWTEYAGSSDFYIADNLFLGRDDRFRLIGWTGPRVGQRGRRTARTCSRATTPSRSTGRGTSSRTTPSPISTTASASRPTARREKDPERQASSIDIYNNDMHMSNDDFIETDGGVHNVRVFNNRGVNAAQGGYSSQPVFGGPVYFYPQPPVSRPDRRGVQVLGQAGRPVRLSQHDHRRAGAARASSNMHFRNNLFLGRDTPGRGIMTWANATDAYSSDYNGFRPNRGVAEQYRLARAQGRAATVRARARRLEELRHAGRVPRGHGPGDARHRSRFRHLRETVSARLRPTATRSITPWT